MENTPSRPKVRKAIWIILILAVVVLCITFIIFVAFRSVEPKKSDNVSTITSTIAQTPTFTTETIASGLDHPWDIAFLPSGQPLFTERSGKISTLQNGAVKEIATLNDVKVAGEAGLMGLAIDPSIATNHFIYTCYTTNSDIRVVRWKLSNDGLSVSDKQPIIPGIFSGAGVRHQGCRIAFGPDGFLWVGTGDAAQSGKNPQPPQDPKSLAGKILRVDRDGKAAPDNLGEPFDGRIYSYGHRNTQGIAFLAKPLGDIIGYSAEHGSTIDDEVNVLKKGNFGWDPDVAYTERNIPMTNTQKFPDSIGAVWSSGSSTQAPSGLAALTGERWKAWDGALAMAVQKDKHLKILLLDENGKITKEERIITDRGRLRDAEQALDGSLYTTTDNGGSNDEIIRLIPN